MILGGFFMALAGTANGVAAPTNVIANVTDVTNLFCGALLWMFWGLMVFSTAMFLVGGYRYATSQGNSEKVGTATKTLTYAAIGVAVALIAGGVPILIGNIFGVSGLNACG